METDLIIVNDYCQKSCVEPSFVVLLGKEGLIEIRVINGVQYVLISQLKELETYTRMYYDLSINIEGIDAIRHLLDRIETLQMEVRRLRGSSDFGMCM